MIIKHYSPPYRNYIPTAELENKLQKNIPLYFAGDLNAHKAAMGYSIYNYKEREIQRLMQQNKIMHLGSDFRTNMHRSKSKDTSAQNSNYKLGYRREAYYLQHSLYLTCTISYLQHQ